MWLLVLVAWAGHEPALADKAMQVHRNLPAVAKERRAAKARKASPQIEAERQKLLAKIDAGEGQAPSKRQQKLEAKAAKIARRINDKLSASDDQRPIVVLLEGPDGAGKSSTIRRLRAAFEGARPLDIVHFGAPGQEYAGYHWSKRFMDKLPANGSVAIWDRSYYGDAVYRPYDGSMDKAATKQRLAEIGAMEQFLSGGVRIIKVFLDASETRQAKTIAKREVLAPQKLSESDYLTFVDRAQIRGLFKAAVKATDGPAVPWTKVSMDDRAKARVQILKAIERALTP